jgi:hypothetical protein
MICDFATQLTQRFGFVARHLLTAGYVACAQIINTDEKS